MITTNRRSTPPTPIPSPPAAPWAERGRSLHTVPRMPRPARSTGAVAPCASAKRAPWLRCVCARRAPPPPARGRPPAQALALPDEITAPLPWDAAFCEHFLSSYWQRRPLLIRQAVPGFASPLSADELAGLACGDAPSRIVLERGGARPWELVRRARASVVDAAPVLKRQSRRLARAASRPVSRG